MKNKTLGLGWREFLLIIVIAFYIVYGWGLYCATKSADECYGSFCRGPIALCKNKNDTFLCSNENKCIQKFDLLLGW